MGFYSFTALIDMKPEPGATYIHSAIEPYNEEQEISQERINAGMDHFGMNKFAQAMQEVKISYKLQVRSMLGLYIPFIQNIQRSTRELPKIQLKLLKEHQEIKTGYFQCSITSNIQLEFS
jgi:hypothetical protein